MKQKSVGLKRTTLKDGKKTRANTHFFILNKLS